MAKRIRVVERGEVTEGGERVPVTASPHLGHVGGYDHMLAAGEVVVAEAVGAPGDGRDIVDGAVRLP